tara:strand:+ start:8555 stop:8974 length:420 start_codon:yes stop_codon:yes gene_type:complete
MNNCAVSFINYKLILNLLLLAGHPFIGVATYRQAWFAWVANLMLCVYATFNCEKRIDPIPIILALTINAKNPSNIWLLAYTLYIIYFTSSIGIPILGLLGVIFPAMMMKNNDEYGPYRMQAVVLTAIILIYFNNFSKVF